MRDIRLMVYAKKLVIEQLLRFIIYFYRKVTQKRKILKSLYWQSTFFKNSLLSTTKTI